MSRLMCQLSLTKLQVESVNYVLTHDIVAGSNVISRDMVDAEGRGPRTMFLARGPSVWSSKHAPKATSIKDRGSPQPALKVLITVTSYASC